MMPIRLHPCDFGDLPTLIQLATCSHFLPISDRNLQSNWKLRYSAFIVRQKIGGLWLDVKKCDNWLDERGKKLLSPQLIEAKKKRNPGWVPARDRVETLVGAQQEILDKLVEIVALKLHDNCPVLSEEGRPE